VLDDVWEWDGSGWTQVGVFPVGPIRSHVLAYNTVCGSIDLISGWDGQTFYQNTWHYDGTMWAIEAAPPPLQRGATAVVPGPGDQTLLLFGGTASDGSMLGDTWVLEH
jgi:hypothetical protein